MKQCKSLTAIISLITILLIMPMFATAQGQGLFPLTYGGNYPYGDLNDPPAIAFSVINGSVLYNNANMTIGFSTAIGYPQGIQTLMTSITSVSYKASWQGNQSTSLFNSTIDTPAVLSNVPSGQEFSYNFTNIPLGSQQLEVDSVGGGIIWSDNTYYTFYTNSSNTLYFTVQATPTKEPFPTLLAITAILVIVVVIGILSMLIYRKHRKPASSSK
jgi:hypothetical protein